MILYTFHVLLTGEKLEKEISVLTKVHTQEKANKKLVGVCIIPLHTKNTGISMPVPVTMTDNRIMHLKPAVHMQCKCSQLWRFGEGEGEGDVYLDKACAHALNSIKLDGEAVV